MKESCKEIVPVLVTLLAKSMIITKEETQAKLLCRLEFIMVGFSTSLYHGMEWSAGKLIHGAIGSSLQRMKHMR